jgi:hypothetical protein
METNTLTLSQIYQKYSGPCGCGDKGTFHSYIEKYELFFEEFRNKKINILEIGVLNGKSVLLWKEFFKDANIYAVDINNKDHLKLKDEKTFILHSDATKNDFLNLIKNIRFDIIIDDGSHILIDQINSFKLLKNSLKEKSLYIIEDVFYSHINSIQNEFNNIFEVLDLRHERNVDDNILMVYKNEN